MASSALAFADRLRARFPSATVTVCAPRGEVGIVAHGDWLETCRALRDEFGFESLIDVCGVDYLGHGDDEWDTDVSNEGFSRGVEGRNVGRFAFGEAPSRQLPEPLGEGPMPVPRRRCMVTPGCCEWHRRSVRRCWPAAVFPARAHGTR